MWTRLSTIVDITAARPPPARPAPGRASGQRRPPGDLAARRRPAPAWSACAGSRARRTSVEVVLGVDLDVRDAGDQRGHVAEHPTGGAARRAERRGELQQRGPLAQGSATHGVSASSDRGRLERRRSVGLVGAAHLVGAAEPAVGDGAVQPEGRRASSTPTRSTHTPVAHGGLNDGSAAPGIPALDTLSRRRRAAGTRRCRPAGPATVAGSSVADGPIADQHRADAEHVGEPRPGCSGDRALGAASARVTGPVDRRASSVDAGGGPGRRPVADGHDADARRLSRLASVGHRRSWSVSFPIGRGRPSRTRLRWHLGSRRCHEHRCSC